jgi:uncharacterized protein
MMASARSRVSRSYKSPASIQPYRGRQAIAPCVDVLLELTDEVVAIVDLQRAKEIVLSETRLSACDALHVAVMERHGLSRIMTFDTGIERVR